MAKKAGPTRPCVNPECAKPIHPRTKVCPFCQTEQPAAKKMKVKAGKPATPLYDARTPVSNGPSEADTVQAVLAVQAAMARYGKDRVASIAQLLAKP